MTYQAAVEELRKLTPKERHSCVQVEHCIYSNGREEVTFGFYIEGVGWFNGLGFSDPLEALKVALREKGFLAGTPDPEPDIDDGKGA